LEHIFTTGKKQDFNMKNLQTMTNLKSFEDFLNETQLSEQMDIYDDLANSEFGMDFDELGSNEQDWVRDEVDKAPKKGK
jgi:hypothetical protein